MNAALNPENPISTISPADAQQKRLEALLLDVRTPAEFEEAHIDGSVLMPLGNLNTEEVKQLAAGKSTCLLICRSGNRARQAAEKLKSSGLPSLQVLTGGVLAWDAAGLPLNRGTKSMSLERQVRIAAGALVFIWSRVRLLRQPGSGLCRRPLSAQDSSLPVSPTPAAWEC